ncbi:DoxX-like family protein [Lentzea fradiae]|uniref:DoxX-like family protein n=1 Tax=Lentzea fradiae TaxID=200378 RepID=A0A1G7SPL3_9PSEU|nr:DoxX family protein [Lentzea fradiae]SDG25036.1 DoxX-like family protein [Lentzea fradiae]
MSEQTSTAAKIGNIVVWILQIVLAWQFFMNGYALFTDQFVAKFDDIGLGQWFRYATGVLEIATAVGLLVPRICGLAALALAGIMTGAALTEVFLVTNGGLDDAKLPLIYVVWALVIAVYRREQILGALTVAKKK